MISLFDKSGLDCEERIEQIRSKRSTRRDHNFISIGDDSSYINAYRWQDILAVLL